MSDNPAGRMYLKDERNFNISLIYLFPSVMCLILKSPIFCYFRKVTNAVCGISPIPVYIMVPCSYLYYVSSVAVDFSSLCLDLFFDSFTGDNFSSDSHIGSSISTDPTNILHPQNLNSPPITVLPTSNSFEKSIKLILCPPSLQPPGIHL